MNKTYICLKGCRLKREELKVIGSGNLHCPIHGKKLVGIEFRCQDCHTIVSGSMRQFASIRCRPCQKKQEARKKVEANRAWRATASKEAKQSRWQRCKARKKAREANDPTLIEQRRAKDRAKAAKYAAKPIERQQLPAVKKAKRGPVVKLTDCVRYMDCLDTACKAPQGRGRFNCAGCEGYTQTPATDPAEYLGFNRAGYDGMTVRWEHTGTRARRTGL